MLTLFNSGSQMLKTNLMVTITRSGFEKYLSKLGLIYQNLDVQIWNSPQKLEDGKILLGMTKYVHFVEKILEMSFNACFIFANMN